MKRLLAASLLIFLAACGTTRKVGTSDFNSEALLFPYGNYRHRVSIQLGQEPDKKMNFSGVVQLKEDVIRIAALSPLGVTVFKVTENRKTGEIKSEVFLEAMKKHESKVSEYYALLRVLLTAPNRAGGSALKWEKRDSEGRPLEAKATSAGQEGTLRFLAYDQNGVPEKVVIESAKFTVEIEVAGYEI